MSNKLNDEYLSAKILGEQMFLLFLVFEVIIFPLLFALKKFEKKNVYQIYSLSER